MRQQPDAIARKTMRNVEVANFISLRIDANPTGRNSLGNIYLRPDTVRKLTNAAQTKARARYRRNRSVPENGIANAG